MGDMRVWQDEYDGIWVHFAGLAGGHEWLMVGLTSCHPQVQEMLEQVPPNFKGNLYVLLLPETTAIPLEQALKLYQPRGVLVLGRNLSGGPGLELPEQVFESTSGLRYLEGGSYPAWNSALDLEGDALPDLWASTCAKLGVPVVVCTPEMALPAFERWLQQTPLALQNLEC